jgi:hypothetical protein
MQYHIRRSPRLHLKYWYTSTLYWTASVHTSLDWTPVFTQSTLINLCLPAYSFVRLFACCWFSSIQKQVQWQITSVSHGNYSTASLSTADTTNYWLLLVQCDLLTPEGVAQSLVAVREDLDQMLLGVHRKADAKSAEYKSKRAAATAPDLPTIHATTGGRETKKSNLC